MVYDKPTPVDFSKLNEALHNYSIGTNQNMEINLQSSFKDVANFFDIFAIFDNKYLEKKNSPDFELSLKLWLNELELQLDFGNSKKLDFKGNGRVSIFGHKLNENFSLRTYTYEKIVKGEKITLNDVAAYLFTSNWMTVLNKEENIIFTLLPGMLLKIAEGYVLAHKLPQLRNELLPILLKYTKSINLIPIHKPLLKKWKCLARPAELANILSLLIIKKYFVSPASSNVKSAEFYLDIFDIKTTPQTIAKELGSSSLAHQKAKEFVMPLKDDSQVLILNREIFLPIPQPHESPQIKWQFLGSHAEFGFIVITLIENGYFSNPALSTEDDAIFFIKLFGIKCSVQILMIELDKKTNTLDENKKSRFKMPRKKS